MQNFNEPRVGKTILKKRIGGISPNTYQLTKSNGIKTVLNTDKQVHQWNRIESRKIPTHIHTAKKWHFNVMRQEKDGLFNKWC